MEDLGERAGDEIRQNGNLKRKTKDKNQNHQWSVPWMVKCFKRLLWAVGDGPSCAWAEGLIVSHLKTLPVFTETVVWRGTQASTPLGSQGTYFLKSNKVPCYLFLWTTFLLKLAFPATSGGLQGTHRTALLC